ncbi:MAG: flagellin [Verrucomicrobiota bacterium]
MPALVINTNVASLNGQRNLGNTTKALNKSLERLSSGLRINRAGDDAAGMAISENLRSQVRGLNMAVRNCSDAVSLIQTAEGTIDTYTEIAQRVRELAIQASSDVNSPDNRAAIQLEISEQLEELDRIAKVMDFNGQPLFDGTFINKRVQAGAKTGETLDISVGDLRPEVVGGVAQNIGTYVDDNAMVDGQVAINGIDIQASSDSTARAKAIAINDSYFETGVLARVELAQITGSGAVAAGTLDLAAGDTITINGVTVPVEGTLAVEANDETGALRRSINSVSEKTGVEANLDSSGQLVLTSMDDSAFNLEVAGGAAAIVGIGAGSVNVNGRLRLYSDEAFTVTEGSNGAADDELSLLGMQGSVSLDANSSIDTIDVTNFESAQEALLQIDNALRQTNNLRAGLGALTNRLNNTIDNVQISVENLSASDSRIRDADFATETAALTRAQILQQSGVAVLAQANNTPQAALQLLQG